MENMSLVLLAGQPDMPGRDMAETNHFIPSPDGSYS